MSMPERFLAALSFPHWLSREDMVVALWPDPENRPKTHAQVVRNLVSSLNRQGQIEILDYFEGKRRKRLLRLVGEQTKETSPQGQRNSTEMVVEDDEIEWEDLDDAELEIEWDD
ncbi:hypothetical protein [Gordonia sp. NPDC003950]